MANATPAEMAIEILRVQEALVQAGRYVAAHDEADAARAGTTEVPNSMLRTLISLAQKAADRLHEYLTTEPNVIEPGPSRDGGPFAS